MVIPQVPGGSIVVGVDGSVHGDRALDWAADVAAQQHRALAVVHSEILTAPLLRAATGMVAADWTDVVASAREVHEEVAARAAARASARRPGLDIRMVVDEVDPRMRLVSDSAHAHLLVVGTRGLGPVAGLVLGSVSGTLVRSASCPVVVVRHLVDESRTPHEVVIAVDGSQDSLPVLEFGFEFAARTARPVRVLHLVWTDPTLHRGVGHRLSLSETVAGLGERFPDVSWTSMVMDGPLADTIVDTVHDAALAVVGRHHARSPERLLYRSTATTVIEHAPCPVAVVPLPPHR